MMRTLRSAVRTMRRGRMYTVLNIGGLAVGLACFGVIAAWVINELSYDRFYTNHDRIVRVVSTVTSASESFGRAVTSLPLASALKQDIPEIEDVVRLDHNNCIVRRNDTQFEEDDVLFTDNSFFSVFETDMLQGDARTALAAPYSVVLTKSISEKYFGDENPVGSSLTMFQYDPDGNGAPYTVTGVVPDPPLNSHFRYRILGSFSTIEQVRPEALTDPWRFFNNNYYTYLLLRRPGDIVQVQQKLPEFTERLMGERSRQLKMSYTFRLQPIADIHLGSHERHEIRNTGSMDTVYMFSSIGLAILLVACINYMNIASARAIGRAKEIGVKKILGAGRAELVRQVLVESLLMSIVGLLFALLLIEGVSPLLSFMGEGALDRLGSTESLGVITLAALLSGLLSGLYPALLLSGFSPLSVVKSWKSTPLGSLTRKSLVVLQFAVTIVLVTGVAVISSQMDYIRSKDLGYNKDALLILDQNGFSDVNTGYDAFRNELMGHAGISGVTTSRGLILGGISNWHVETVNGSGQPVSSNVYSLMVGPDFLDVYDIPLVAGRHLSNTDMGSAFIVNEATVRQFGWGSPQEAIGKPFRAGGTREAYIVGVVSDFNFTSLRQQVEPFALSQAMPNVFSRIAVRIAGSDLAGVRGFVEETWKKHFPSALLKASFLDERLERQYQTDVTFERVFGTFMTLSILIACLGLFGLASYAIERRMKEIGVRRVLGASVPGLIGTLSKEFLALVAAAFVLGAPIAWLVMSHWLSDFSYRVVLGPAPFLFAGFVALAVAFVTVGAEAYRAARRNPVDSLRYE